MIAALNQAPVLLIAALGFSALGDMLLARENDRGFLSGMAAFFTAHIAYAILFTNYLPPGGVSKFQVVASIILILLSAAIYRYLRAKLGAFRVPVGLYTVAIAVMGIAATGLPFAKSFGLALLGAGLFMASDIMLAIEKFRPPDHNKARRYMPYLVWALYWFAQVLILLGILWSI
ncbi:MAG: lysoplasmalogenase [Alphaproteobacteria bacterium]|nr:lysoplasmalogenase [Alphaproteobacteria bacterium]